jgi:mono/diheme cytochrome c family protein
MEVDMFPKLRFALGLTLILSFALTIPVFAGGWAVVTLDELPTNVVAGEPLTIGFTVLQHGRTPVDGLKPTITFTLYKEKQVVFDAKEDGKPGHYSATVILPKEGEWNWSINAFGKSPMPAISVTAPAVAIETQPVETAAALPPLLIVRALAFGIGLIALLFTIRSKSRAAMAFTALCLTVGVASFMTGAAVPEVDAQGSSSFEMPVDSSISQVELGQRLFLVKGCISCHVNTKVGQSGYWTVEMGAPDLTNFSASPETLRLRLKDPSSVNSNTQMPNLNLSDAEIEALIAFINSE